MLPWLLIASGGLILRLIYVLGVRQTPVVWDSHTYDQGGQALAHWLGPGLPDLLGAILGWRVSVLRHLAMDLANGVLPKGPTYPLFLGLIYLLFGHHLAVARVFQAVLDTGTALLVGGVARELGDRRSGLAASALYALYQPMILMVGRVMKETLVIFLLALAVWLLVRSLKEPGGVKTTRLVAMGSLLGAVIEGSPSLQYLFLFLLPAYLVTRAARTRQRVQETLWILVGVLGVVFPVMALIKIQTGKVSINSVLAAKAERNLFHGLHPSSSGWIPDLSDPNGQGGPPDSLGDPHIPPGQTYRQATIALLLKHPLAPWTMGIRKAYRYYALPCADWHEQYLIPRSGVVALHKVLVLFGLFGAICALADWRRVLVLLALALYVHGVYSLLETEVRYAMPALVAWVPLAGYGMVRLAEGIAAHWRRGQASRVWILALTIGVLLLSLPLLQVPCLLAVLPSLDPLRTLRLSWILEGLTLMLVLLSLDRLFRLGSGDLSRRVAMGLAGALVATVALAHDTEEGGWHEWKAPLAGPSRRVEQSFHLPEGVRESDRAYLMADVLPELSRDEPVRVRFNDLPPIVLDAASLGGDCFRRYLDEADKRWEGGYSTIEREYRLDPARMRKWLQVIVPQAVRPGDVLRVTLDLPSGGRLEVYGDFLPRGGGTYHLQVPSLDVCRISLHTSIFRFFNERDYRIPEDVRLTGKVTASWWEGSRMFVRDLSPEPGIQTGRYRVFLVIERVDGTRLVL